MDCKYTTIKTCELKGSTFRSHILDFGTFDISGYEFTADFANTLGAKIATQQLEKFGNIVILPLTALESKSGNIRADVWMSKDGIKDLAVRFDISISSNCTGCSGDTTAHDITITYEELVIPVTVTQAVVNISLDYEAANQAAENANNAATAANEAANEATEAAEIALSSIGIEHTTYEDLVLKINASTLHAGKQYRIIDYVTTVSSNLDYAISAGNAFDIIVTADTENVLNSSARAVRREGDTYFPDFIDFSKWEINYDINNNVIKYDWADDNGKGVIYYMKDDLGNELPYDFKNIKFKRCYVTESIITEFESRYLVPQNNFSFNGQVDRTDSIFCYTFHDEDYDTDISVSLSNGYKYFGNNIIKKNSFTTIIDDIMFETLVLNDVVFMLNIDSRASRNIFGFDLQLCTFSGNFYDNTIGNNFYSNTIGNYFYSNTIGNNFYSNTIGNYFYSNTIGNNFSSNTIGNNFSSNTSQKFAAYIYFADGINNKNFSAVTQLYSKDYSQRVFSTYTKAILEWYNDSGTRNAIII